MSQGITKDYLDSALRGAIKEVVQHFNGGQAAQNERLSGLESRLGGVAKDLAEVKEDLASVKDDLAKVKLAVLDYLATDRAVRNLVRELKAQGIALDERKIFAA